MMKAKRKRVRSSSSSSRNNLTVIDAADSFLFFNSLQFRTPYFENLAMEVFYYMVFGGLGLIVAALELSKNNKDRVTTSQAFTSFKNNYLLVYSLMMAGDWLQGPYVYYLYTTYGYGKGDIGQLFIAGFGSSMLFGTIVGSLADKQGRKRACVTYCITYILSCMTKHSPHYKVLLLGRILGGVATSLLFSAFESWLVAEHNKRGFEQQWLSLTFSKAIFLGNGLVAIISGLFGNFLVDAVSLGPVAPFDAAACILAIGMAIILSSWGENYGDPSENKDLLSQFKGAAVAIASDEKIALLGAIQSLFEGSMYTFVFLWTPALSPNDEEIPHGFIFATFMLASMLGSSFASRLMARSSPRVESYMQIVFLVSAASLLLPIVTNFFIAPPEVKSGGISLGGCVQLLGFCTFEACVGIFWPSIMKMRSQYIPEEARSTIMNFFRIPLNIFVCVVLYNVNAFPITIMFGMCSIFLFVASVLQRRLLVITDKPKSENWTSLKERDVETEPLNDA
ncbi:Major facilitator superfamily domain, general substrate transporter [Cynara cardunculus var. scolymus]|uniref:Major facilitator superfamily domain, general substrate transporter n=2 Tax=Cynara cardunculus var. scolymus TaxID=59895 RepID=A0A118K665_CYNCS|nr:Major facilitator superfamily domain, general substrate transporter [Cynara cardunculus var. scolymus]